LALEFLYRAVLNTKHGARDVILFPGTWNPPTIAHLEIARAAREHADEVIWVLPRVFPHKGFDGAGFDERCRMIQVLTRQEPGFSAAVAGKGLYVEIAEEAAETLGPDTRIRFVLGRDAAERIAAWDYGQPGVFDRFVERHALLVAARDGEYEPAACHRKFISILPMKSFWNEVSSTEIRRRISQGENWSHLAPPGIESTIREIYSRI
jgi:nicotinate (nicotinamide) nucleotide adenylyltransferase